MAYQPLTPEQFNAAKSAGFSPDRIIQMEQKRKTDAMAAPTDVSRETSGTAVPQAPSTLGKILQGAGDIVGGLAKSVAAPVATMVARPIQAIAELAGASSDDVDRVTKNLTGGLVAPVPQNMADVKKDAGRAAETVALGLGPVAGGAAFGAGSSVEAGNDVFSGKTAVSGLLGAAGGKVLDVAAPYIAKGVSKVTPQIIKDAAGAVGSKIAPVADAIGEGMAKTKILPDNVSQAINKGADMVNKAPGAALDAVKNQYGFASGNSPEALKRAAEASIPKALGSSGKRSAGVFGTQPGKQLQGLETLHDYAPALKVTGENGEKVAYDPKTATLPQHVEALNDLKGGIYSQIEDDLKKADGKGAKVTTKPVMTTLQQIADDVGRTGTARNRAMTLIKDIKQLKTPTQVNSYLKDLNTGLSGILTGGSQSIERSIDLEATRGLNKALDDTIANASEGTGNIRLLKNHYSNLKSVEQGLVTKAQQMARKVGSGISDYINPFNVADALDILSHNPVGAAKAGVRAAMLARNKMMKDPEQILQGIFKNIGDYKAAGFEKVAKVGNIPATAAKAPRTSFGRSMIPAVVGGTLREANEQQ